MSANNSESKWEQDGWLAPACFSPNYKYFDQLLQTVKNETTVLNLNLKKGFLQTSIPPLISIFYAKEGVSRFFVEIFCLKLLKKFAGEPSGVSENFGYRKILCLKGGGVLRFSVENFLSHSIQTFRRGTLLFFGKFLVAKNVKDKRERGDITIFRRNCFVSQYRKNSEGNLLVFQKISGIEKFYASER